MVSSWRRRLSISAALARAAGAVALESSATSACVLVPGEPARSESGRLGERCFAWKIHQPASKSAQNAESRRRIFPRPVGMNMADGGRKRGNYYRLDYSMASGFHPRRFGMFENASPIDLVSFARRFAWPLSRRRCAGSWRFARADRSGLGGNRARADRGTFLETGRAASCASGNRGRAGGLRRGRSN